MIKGIYVRDGKAYTVDCLDRPVDVEPPKPWITATPLVLTGEMEKMVVKHDWKAKRRNQLRCRIVRASVYIAAAIAMVSLLSLEGLGLEHLGIVLSVAGVNVAWVALVTAVNGGKA